MLVKSIVTHEMTEVIEGGRYEDSTLGRKCFYDALTALGRGTGEY